MDALDYWRLCDRLSLIQAALLIAGVDPADHELLVENWEDPKPRGYQASRAALIYAVKKGELPAEITREYDAVGNEGFSWHATMIEVEDLRQWLRKRGIKTGFFFPSESDGPDYLNPAHDKYAPKLAAAVGAWSAVATNPELTRGRSVKQALVIWLRQNANTYQLTKDDGNPNDLGIEEVAKVANWDMQGGAPKTPT